MSEPRWSTVIGKYCALYYTVDLKRKYSLALLCVCRAPPANVVTILIVRLSVAGTSRYGLAGQPGEGLWNGTDGRQGRGQRRLVIIVIIIIIIIITPGQCLWCCNHDTSHCESSPGSSDECRTAPDGRRPSDQANRPGLRVY